MLLKYFLILISICFVDSFINSLNVWGSSLHAPCFGMVPKKKERGRTKISSSQIYSTVESGSLMERNGSLSFGGSNFLVDINSDVSFNQTDPKVFFLEIETAQQHDSLDLRLGKLNCDRFLACVRQKLWWMVPSWGSRAGDLTCETQFLLLRLKPTGNSSAAQGHKFAYAVIIPLVSGDFRASLQGSLNSNDKDVLHLRLSRFPPIAAPRRPRSRSGRCADALARKEPAAIQ